MADFDKYFAEDEKDKFNKYLDQPQPAAQDNFDKYFQPETLEPQPPQITPQNFTVYGQQRDQYLKDVERQAASLDLNTVLEKQKSGQPLTPVEQSKLFQTSGMADPNVPENPVNIALLTAGAFTPITSVGEAALGPVLSKVVGEGIVGGAIGGSLNIGESLSQGQKPNPVEVVKATGLGAIAGGLGGGVAGVMGTRAAYDINPGVGNFGTKVKDGADFLNISPNQFNKGLKEAVDNGLASNRGEALDQFILQASDTEEGAVHFAKYLKESAQAPTGLEGVKALGENIPQVQKTTMGAVFEGDRLVEEARKGLIESGVEFQSPAVRDAYIGSPFQAPETREIMRQQMIKESSLFTRPVYQSPPIVKTVINTNKPVSELAQEIAEGNDTIFNRVMYDAHVEARKTGKNVKDVLAEKATELSAKKQEAIDVIVGSRVVSNVYTKQPEIANRINLDYQQKMAEIVSPEDLSKIFDDLDRPMTPRTGNTVTESGKIMPNFQAIMNNNEKLANMMENYYRITEQALPDKLSIPLDESYQLAKELPNSELADALSSGQRNLNDLYEMQVKLTAVKLAAKEHFNNRLLPTLERFQAGKATEEELFQEMATQTQMGNMVGLTGSGTGRLFRSMRTSADEVKGTQVFLKKLENILGKPGKQRAERMTELITDLKDLSPEERLVALAKAQDAGLWEKWRFIMKAGMLSGGRTQERNTLSNQITFYMREVQKEFEAVGNAVVSKFTGKPRTKFLREGPVAAGTYLTGYKNGATIFFKKLRNRVSGEEASKFEVLAGKGMNLYRNPLGTGKVATAIEFPFRLLDAADSAQKEMIIEAETARLSYRYARQILQKRGVPAYKALSKTQELIDLTNEIYYNPTDELLAPIGKTVKEFSEEIKHEALVGTYQQSMNERIAQTTLYPKLKEYTSTERQLIGFASDPIGSVGVSTQLLKSHVPLVDIVQPFLNVPVNVTKFQFERTPPLSTVISLGKILARKAAGAPLKLDEEIAKNTIGTVLAMGTAIATYEGFITGGVVPDQARTGINQLARGSQRVPYSINIGGEQIPYIFFEPIGPMIALYADATELSMTYPLLSEDWSKGMARSFANNISRRAFFESLGTLWDAWNGDWDKAKSSLGFMLVGNVVPFSGALRTVGIASDVRRNGKGFLPGIMEQLPFLREQLPPARNRWGQKIYNADTMVKKLGEWMGISDPELLDMANRVGVAFLPLPTFEKISDDPVDKAMIQLINKMGPGETFDRAGTPRKTGRLKVLSDEEFDAFQEANGAREKQAIQELITAYGPRYEEMISNPEMRAYVIKDIEKAIKRERELSVQEYLYKHEQMQGQ